MAKRKSDSRTVSPRQSTPSQSARRPMNFAAIRTIIIVVFVLAVLYAIKGFFISAIVNGQPIWRTSVVSQLESQGGKQTLDSLISKNLLLQEAKRRHITVSNSEVDQEIAKLEASVKKQGGSLDQLLQIQGVSREQLRDQVYIQKLLEKMFTNDIKVSDKEVSDFLTQNKSAFPQGVNTSAAREQAKQQVMQNKLGAKVQELLQTLKAKAHIQYFVSYPSSALPQAAPTQ